MAKVATREEREAEPPKEGGELETSRMPFLSHLRELRDRVRNAALFFVAAFILCFVFNQQIFEWLEGPMKEAWDVKKLGDFKVVYTNLTEPFWVGMSIALWAGIFVASPFIFYQIWSFIAPGLYKRERRITIAFAFFSAIFFIGGALFCYYFVLPNLYEFLLGYSTAEQKAMIRMESYLDLTRDMMLAFGAVFELPLLIVFLSMVGMVTHRSLWKFNRWFVVIAFIVGAILTPSPDVPSQLMMAGPMIVLYNLSILVAWYVTNKREARDLVLREKERLEDEKELAMRGGKSRPDDDDD